MDNSNLVKQINDALVMQGITLDDLAKLMKTKKKDLINIMKREGFIFDKIEGYFIKENTLTKRIEKLEIQQKVILESLELLKKEKEVAITILEKKDSDLEVLQGDIIQKSFKLYKNTADKFKTYCKKHNELKVQEIITLALDEYMKNH